MDVIFNCPKCEQELAVDSSGAGSEIECPSCGEGIVIPQPEPQPLRAPHVPPPAGTAPSSAMTTSAAAKVEMHLKVPVRSEPTASLIEKPLAPLESASKDNTKRLKIKTIKHTDCIEVGHDKFDEVLTAFLEKIGEANIVKLHVLTYTHIDIGSQKLLTDFGVMVVYRN